VDAVNADFLSNEEHLQALMDALKTEFEGGQQYISL
jgi:hypothetical protein